ncbi:MAG TPA: aminotransferase class I/II-fold pyridoxal phosphate-dependent enzyme, partial [Stellaceae bacterium]|nr:aminotransferase class I/II-fold pyridoxal phosphate-dependent enzyme [Stellaceae bacterium]
MPHEFRELPTGLRPRTVMARAGLLRSQYMETCEAIYMNSGYVYRTAEEAESAFAQDGSRFVYSRYANPTVNMLEERLRLLEGAEGCRATASGMAAVFAALACQVKAGDRVVSSRALFNSCNYIITQILPRYGVETVLVDGRDLDAWKRALALGVKAVFCESPSNPTLELVDLAAVAELTHRAGGVFVVDNVFATPLLQRPLQLGADIVCYSATKHIDGQGRSLGGAVLGSDKFVRESLMPFLRHTGPALSPFNAWLLLKGIETLPLRVEAMSRGAAEVAAFLERHPKVERTLYPGLESHPQYALARRQMSGGGTLVALSVKGGKAGAFRFQNALRLIEISNNL